MYFRNRTYGQNEFVMNLFCATQQQRLLSISSESSLSVDCWVRVHICGLHRPAFHRRRIDNAITSLCGPAAVTSLSSRSTKNNHKQIMYKSHIKMMIIQNTKRHRCDRTMRTNKFTWFRSWSFGERTGVGTQREMPVCWPQTKNDTWKTNTFVFNEAKRWNKSNMRFFFIFFAGCSLSTAI